jgi:hypothetical protein
MFIILRSQRDALLVSKQTTLRAVDQINIMFGITDIHPQSPLALHPLYPTIWDGPGFLV